MKIYVIKEYMPYEGSEDIFFSLSKEKALAKAREIAIRCKWIEKIPEVEWRFDRKDFCPSDPFMQLEEFELDEEQ